MQKLTISQKKKDYFFKYGIPYFWCLYTSLIFGPLELYFSNKEEFWFELLDFLPLLIVIVLIAWMILMLLHLFFKKVMKLILKAVWILSVCIYVQGDFIPVTYGVMDGTEIDWNSYGNYGIINSCVWMGLIVFFLVLCRKFGKKIEKVIPVLSVLMFTMQFTAIAFLTVSDLNTNDERKYYLTNKGMYDVGSELNTIVFILDAFDSEVFYELLNTQDAAWISQFEGFHYYRDTVGGATRTRYALPYILSGQPYTKEETYSEYVNRSGEESVLYKQIKERKINACLYTGSTYVGHSQTEVIDNCESTKLRTNSIWGLTGDILKLTAFRNFPHELKKYFWMYSGDFEKWKAAVDSEGEPYTANDIKFYQNLEEMHLSVGGGYTDAFRLFHLNGAHAPYNINENIEYVTSEETGEMQQALGSLNIVTHYMNQLKELELYESSTIIIMADHGCDRGIEQNPLFMIKPSNCTGEFQSVDFAFSYANLQEVFYNAFQAEKRYPEEYVDEIKPRLFYVGGGSNAVMDYTEYVVHGNAYDYDSIEATGNIFHGTMDAVDCEYELGTVLKTEDWTLNSHCISGFSGNEITHTWTDGYEAVLQFDLSENYENLLLSMDYRAYNSKQRVYIYANDQLFASYLLDGTQPDTFIIPKEYIINGHLKLKFILPDAAFEKPNGKGRKLALSMKSIKILSTDKNINIKEQIQISDSPAIPEEQ